MKKYLKVDGSVHDTLPCLEDYVEDEDDAVVGEVFAVQLLDEELNVVANEILRSTNYPSKNTIKWCLLKHKAAYASVRKLHELQY